MDLNLQRLHLEVFFNYFIDCKLKKIPTCKHFSWQGRQVGRIPDLHAGADGSAEEPSQSIQQQFGVYTAQIGSLVSLDIY